MIKYPLRVISIPDEDYFSDIIDANESTISQTILTEKADSLVLRLNWLAEYSDQFLIEMGSLQKLIAHMTKLNDILRDERDEEINNNWKLLNEVW